MNIYELKSPKGARKRKRILGRGESSGRGKTSGKGHKGQKARAGRGILRQLEGGQMPLIRRLPKVGFRPKAPTVYQLVNLRDLQRVGNSSVVDASLLKQIGLIKNIYKPYKILGAGELKKKLTVKAYGFSKSAEEKIAGAGGKIEIITAQQIVAEEQKKSK